MPRKAKAKPKAKPKAKATAKAKTTKTSKAKTKVAVTKSDEIIEENTTLESETTETTKTNSSPPPEEEVEEVISTPSRRRRPTTVITTPSESTKSARKKRGRSPEPVSSPLNISQPEKMIKKPNNPINLNERIESVEERMMKMGLPISFGSTKGKFIDGANPKGVHQEKEIEFKTWLRAGKKKKTTGEVRR